MASRRRELFSFLICLLFGVGGPTFAFFYLPQTTVLPRLFSFSEGAWQAKQRPLERAVFSGLSAPVDIAFDTNGIPHIVAQNDDDLYFAQGVLTAHFRLFQMDVMTRQGLGRLSELFGTKALNFDRFFVTFGMRSAVRTEAGEMMKDSKTAAAITAYLRGVNTYIEQLTYAELPLEYKLTGTWPEAWTPERVASLLKVMTFNLAGRSNDLRLTKILKALGDEKTELLFPEFLKPAFEEFIVADTKSKRSDFNWKYDYVTKLAEFPAFLQPVETNGSNCWAVGPQKSKTGSSVLANDTHLGLQMPAVWFETQLLSPETNVYGATFPGAPGIILGFNSKLAWGVTNGTTDVLDWYEIHFKDAKSWDYQNDLEWKSARRQQEVIEVKNGTPVQVEPAWTDFGTVMWRSGETGLAAKWSGHVDSQEFKSLLGLAHASSVQDCLAALQFWSAPIQNFTCADEKNIAVYHVGRIPIRASGQGRVVQKASHDTEWKGFIPYNELPQAVNPESGIVYSANERPAGPDYPYYLGWDFEEPFRAQRIRAQLLDKNKLDGQDFIQLQNDILNQHASLALPLLLKYFNPSGMSDSEKSAYDLLKQWDYFERARSVEPSLFDRWWKHIEALLWAPVKLDERPWYPHKARTLQFFHEYEEDKAKFADWLKPHADLSALVTKAFHDAVADLTQEFGSDTGEWLWGKVQPTELMHVARIPGLSSGPFMMDGGAYSVMANKGHHGPAWKLVVELGEQPRAWSQFPGGVTGNPLDPEYDKFVEAWSRGEMRVVQFYKDAKEAETGSQYVWHWGRI